MNNGYQRLEEKNTGLEKEKEKLRQKLTEKQKRFSALSGKVINLNQ
ncbi:hypothetical protein [Coxiella endosymbiont of Ornithodoros amblus]|nr:hypothetical protein [Coxiella endosymbiont of Ornithodoros amblus]